MFLLTFIITALLQVCLISTTSEYTDYSSSTKYCYSCMSEDFLLHWQYLDEVYYRPMNFTDHCFKIPAKMHIGMVPCSHSMCVTLIEPRILAGQHIGNNIIRGCFSSVFKYGVTPKAQASPVSDVGADYLLHKLIFQPNEWGAVDQTNDHTHDNHKFSLKAVQATDKYKQLFDSGKTESVQIYTSCTRMPAHRLLPPHLGRRSSNRSVELCWCVGQLCNDYPTVPMNSIGRPHPLFLMLLWVWLLNKIL